MNEFVINVINIDPWQEASSISSSVSVDMIMRNREERALSVVKQSKQHGFSVRFWEGIIEKKGCTGISKAFKKIIRWAKETGQSSVIIAEDDILFSAPGAWAYYIKNIPEDYDVYLGGIYSGNVDDGRVTNGYSGNTLIMINERFYDFILSSNEDDHLDRWLGNFAFKQRYMVCEPYVVYQMEGYSENLRRPTSHAHYLDKMNLFAG